MKRFIDLRGQIYNDDDLPKKDQEPVFAFFCTTTDTFHKFSNEMEWDSIDGFKEAFTGDIKWATHNADGYSLELLDRLLSLIPEWVPQS